MGNKRNEVTDVACGLAKQHVEKAFYKLILPDDKLLQVERRIFCRSEMCERFSLPANSLNLVVFSRFY